MWIGIRAQRKWNEAGKTEAEEKDGSQLEAGKAAR
jgi:hypothetical protein